MIFHFALKRREITLDQIIPPGDEREIAIPAAMPAEGDVDVRRAEGWHGVMIPIPCWRCGLVQDLSFIHNSRRRGGIF